MSSYTGKITHLVVPIFVDLNNFLLLYLTVHVRQIFLNIIMK